MVHSILKLEYNVINFEYNRGRGTSWKLFPEITEDVGNGVTDPIRGYIDDKKLLQSTYTITKDLLRYLMNY